MARGRKKQEVEQGYVKERFIVDLVLSEEELAKINEVGKTKYISDLVKKDFNTSKSDEASYSLTVTDEIREKFNSDPRRAYLLGQLLTEFYCNIKTESTPVVNVKVEPVKVNTKVEKTVEVENEEIAVEEEVEIEDINIEATVVERYEQKEVKDEVLVEDKNDTITNIDEVVVEMDKSEEINNPVNSRDGRVGRLNTAPLMKKRLGDKNR